MPTYQYACTECGHGFEAVQSFSDDALTECPRCQGRLRKVFSSVGIVFKGSGFYRTDSREKATSGPGSSDAPAKADLNSDAKPDGAKTESKPDSTPAKKDAAKTSSTTGTSGSGSSTKSRSSTEGSAA